MESNDLLVNHKRIVNISDLIGSWGPFQKRLFALIGLIYCVAPFNNTSLFYYAVKENLICETFNGSQIVLPEDKCSFGDLNVCKKWYFNTDRVLISNEWMLICERYWLRSLTLAAYIAGEAIAGFTIGYLSDESGRKLAIKFCILIEIFCEFILVFTKSFPLFIGLRFIHGIGGYGRSLCTIILMMESVDLRYRAKVMFWYDALWHGSSIIMITITYHVLSFRYIFLATTVYQLFCLWLMRYLPESPRWQLVSGHTAEAKETLRKFTSIQMTTDQFEEKFTRLNNHLSKFSEIKQLGMSSLFRHFRTTRLVLILCLIWFLRTLSGSSIHYCTLDIPGNVWVNNVVISAFALSSVLLMTLRADNYRRKVLLNIFFSISSILYLHFAFFLTQSTASLTMKVFSLAFATFCNGALHNILYVYTPEVFPTSIRNLGTGICAMASELASIFGPFVNTLTAATNQKVTFLWLSIPTMLATLSLTVLPETKGIEMPDTVEQMLLTQYDECNLDESEDDSEVTSEKIDL